MKLKEIDLSKIVNHTHPDIDLDIKKYLVKISGHYFVGGFCQYSEYLSFNGWGKRGLQLGTPENLGHNWWEGVWEIVE